MHKSKQQSSQVLSFCNSANYKLDARLESIQDPHAFAIMCHCFTCTKDSITTHRISRGLAQKGIAVLRFDFTGLGKSEGSFADSNFDTMLDDLLSAAAFLAEHFQAASLLIGHSMGGTVALAAADQINSCSSVITLASPSEPAHVLHHFESVLDDLDKGHAANIQVAGTAYPVKPQFVNNVRRFSMREHLAQSDLPIMIIRATDDELVSAHNADEILTMSNNARSHIVDIESANHLFTQKSHTAQVIELISQWQAETN